MGSPDKTNADSPGDRDERQSELVPLEVNGQIVYISATRLSAGEIRPGAEREIAAHRPTPGQVLDGLTGFAHEVAARLSKLDASRVTVELGCEFAIESGTIVAVIGKASARSAVKVGLEWNKPES